MADTVSTVEYVEICPKTDIFLFKQGLHLARNSYCTNDYIQRECVLRFEKGCSKYFIYVCDGIGYSEIGYYVWKLPPSEGDENFIETLRKLSERGDLDILCYQSSLTVSTNFLDAMKKCARE